jgi:hypothetical protein
MKIEECKNLLKRSLISLDNICGYSSHSIITILEHQSSVTIYIYIAIILSYILYIKLIIFICVEAFVEDANIEQCNQITIE